MLRFDTLSSLRLRSENGNDLTEAIRQPKRLALLAYLVVAGAGGYVRRDSLVALLWPELPDERARAALRKALHYLRSALGSDVLRTRGEEEICIDTSALRCDACEMRDLAARGEYSRALTLYGGEFLPGLHVSDAPEFEQWIDGERFSLRTTAIECAVARARELAAERSFEEALKYARRSVELGPTDESTTRLLISILVDAGDRSAAIATYSRFAERLGRELELEPGPELRQLIESARSPAVVGSATTSAHMRHPFVAITESSGDSLPRPRSRVRRFLILGATPLVILGVFWGVQRVLPRDATDAMVMFPIHLKSADTSYNVLRDGAVDLFAMLLAGDALPRAVDPRLAVSAWHSAVARAGRDLTIDEARALGRKLGAGRVLLVDMVTAASIVTATGRIIGVADGKVLAVHSETGPRVDLAFVTRLVGRLVARVTGEAAHRLAGLSDSTSAVAAYLAGMRAYRLGQDETAYRQFGRALEIDSTFAAAALWQSYAARMSIGGHVIEADSKAWTLRGRMSRRDRALLSARYAIGPNYPAPSTDADLIAAAGRAAFENPDRVEALADWGRQMLQDGALAEIRNSRELATAILDSAIALDSSFSAALEVRLWTAVELGNTADIRRIYDLYLKRNPDAQLLDLERWMVARALPDSMALSELRSRYLEFDNWVVGAMAAHSAVMGASLADAEDVLLAKAAGKALKPGWRMTQWRIAAARGESRRAMALADTVLALSTAPGGDIPAMQTASVLIELAIADTGYAAVGAEAAQRLRVLVDASNDPAVRATARCYSSLWLASRGDTTDVRQTITRIRGEVGALPIGLFPRIGRLDVCPLLLEAQLEASRRALKHTPNLDALESLMRRGVGFEWPGNLANLMIARWRDATGDYPGALAAIRRTMHALPITGGFIPLRPAFLREEGRLAALTGDSPGAIRAYQSFLAMRDQPDSDLLREEVRDARAALAVLMTTATHNNRGCCQVP